MCSRRLRLGADAVLIGRASLYGLAAAGASGVERAVAILKEELTRTMKLCGVTDVAEIDERFLLPRQHAPQSTNPEA